MFQFVSQGKRNNGVQLKVSGIAEKPALHLKSGQAETNCPDPAEVYADGEPDTFNCTQFLICS
jgi:hypothetical protein